MLKAIPGISKKILVVLSAALFLVSIVFFVSPGKIFGATLEVGASKTYTKIQDAINAATAGDTIVVGPGTYNESIVVNKQLTILGAKANVDPRPSFGGRSGDESIIVSGVTALSIRIGANNVVINGFTFRSEINNSSLNVVEAIDAAYPQILYNIVYNINPAGQSNEGIKVRRSGDSGAVISYNYVYDIPSPGDAINFDTVNGGIIANNEVRNIRSANASIYIYTSQNTILESNIIDATTVNSSIKLGDKTGSDISLSGGQIINNIIKNTNQDAITIIISNVLIEGNEISGCSSENGAIYLAYGIKDITINKNKIHDNSFKTSTRATSAGILIGTQVDATNVHINSNSIYNNTPYGITNETNTALDATNNWWGAASGPFNATSNPSGTGDAVSDNVNFTPWLTNPVGYVAPTPPTPPTPITPITPIKYVQQTVGAGTDTVNASGAYVTVTGSGGQTITIEVISSSTASERGFSIEGATIYIDLHINSPEGIEKIQFTILGGAGIPRWLKGSTWIECLDYIIDANGNFTITITNSTTPSLSDLTGTVFTVFGKPWVRTMPMTCYQVWINEDNKFQFIFWYPYRDNNWVRIYDMAGKMVYEIDMPYDNPNPIVDLPDGMYTVKTFTVGSTEPIQEFVIGKP